MTRCFLLLPLLAASHCMAADPFAWPNIRELGPLRVEPIEAVETKVNVVRRGKVVRQTDAPVLLLSIRLSNNSQNHTARVLGWTNVVEEVAWDEHGNGYGVIELEMGENIEGNDAKELAPGESCVCKVAIELPVKTAKGVVVSLTNFGVDEEKRAVWILRRADWSTGMAVCFNGQGAQQR